MMPRLWSASTRRTAFSTTPRFHRVATSLQALVADLSQAVYYEPGLIVAEGDLVAIRGWAGTPQVVVELFRIEGGRLAEHWDVLQNEVPVTDALGGISMFDPEEGAHLAQRAAASSRAVSSTQSMRPVAGPSSVAPAKHAFTRFDTAGD